MNNTATTEVQETNVPETVAALVPTPRVRDTVLTSTDLDDLTDQLVSGCMTMLDSMPNTVFKICQLIVISSKRNGDVWRAQMFKQLFLEVRWFFSVMGCLSITLRCVYT